METIQQPQILREVQDLAPQIVAARRHIHENPELRYEEYDTAAYIARWLRDLQNIEVIENVGKTGVVGVLRGRAAADNAPCVLLRADMDALPLQEKSGEAFESKRAGKHHACGHDAHVAILLGAATILSREADSLRGVVKFAFQPAEEGGAGGKAMIEDELYPVLDAAPRVDRCYALHVNNSRLYPEVRVSAGPMTANSDRFVISVQGVGSHAMAPQMGVDAVMVGASLVQALYTIPARNLDPLNAFTLSVGRIDGGTAANIVASKCRIEGTTRTLTPYDRERMRTRIEEVCRGFATTYACTVDVEYIQLYDATVNDARAADDIKHSATKIMPVGPGNFGLAGEDFSFFSKARPSAIFLLASAPEGSVLDEGRTVLRPHHSPFFTIDERAMLIGTSVWVQLVRDLLGADGKWTE